jgi:hypothetical protein
MTALPEIEARAYGPEASPEEVEAIRARVQRVSPGLIIYREVPVMSVFQVRITMARLRELFAEAPAAIIVDLNDRPLRRPPDAECRALLTENLRELSGQITSFAVATRNPLYGVTARFVAATLPFDIERFRTVEEAREALDGG